MHALKTQAWVLLSICSIAFGFWHGSFWAAVYFFFLILLIGTALTGWTEWLLQRLGKKDVR